MTNAITLPGKILKMASIDEQILKATKEIVVKFIEAGRISPSGFPETFNNVYHTVSETVKGSEKPIEQDTPEK